MTEEDSPAWRRVLLARRPGRPGALDYVDRLLDRFHELHGDRLTGDDPALVGGIGAWHQRPVVVLGQQKGRTMEERRARNLGMMHPEGFRRAMRLARLGAKFGMPVLTLVDTPGASPDAVSEEHGIASAIGRAIMEWFQVPVPVVASIIGEGGSGGALGLAVGDRVLMLEHAIYSVASPEACASIVWRDTAHRQTAADQLGLGAEDLLRAGIVDEVVAEPAGGAHADPDEAARLLDRALTRHVRSLLSETPEALVRRRRERYRALNGALI